MASASPRAWASIKSENLNDSPGTANSDSTSEVI